MHSLLREWCLLADLFSEKIKQALQLGEQLTALSSPMQTQILDERQLLTQRTAEMAEKAKTLNEQLKKLHISEAEQAMLKEKRAYLNDLARLIQEQEQRLSRILREQMHQTQVELSFHSRNAYAIRQYLGVPLYR